MAHLPAYGRRSYAIEYKKLSTTWLYMWGEYLCKIDHAIASFTCSSNLIWVNKVYAFDARIQKFIMDWFNILVIIHLTIQFLLSISAAILNGLFIVALVKKRALRTPSNTVLGCLCCSDLLIGILTLPVWGFNVLISVKKLYLESIEPFIAIAEAFWILTGFSSLFMVLVNFDRYIAICHPFKYQQYAAPKLYTVISVSSCLVYAIAITITYVIDKIFHAFYTSVICIIIIGATTLILTYFTCKIAEVVRRHKREIASVASLSEAQTEGHQRETKRYRIILLLVVIFFFCKLPHILSYMLIIIKKVQFNMLLLIISALSDNLLLLNSLLNPIVYCYRISVFRNVMKEVLSCQMPV